MDRRVFLLVGGVVVIFLLLHNSWTTQLQSFGSLRDELAVEQRVVALHFERQQEKGTPILSDKRNGTEESVSPEISPKDRPLATTPFLSSSTCQASSLAHQGLIIVSLLGRMGNNLFQIAVANRLAQQLCWPVVYRPSWQGPLAHDARMRTCFDQAFVHATAGDWKHVPDPVWQFLNVSSSQAWEQLQKQRSNAQFDALKNRVRQATATSSTDWWYELDDNSATGHKGQFLDDLVQAIHNGTLPTRVLHVRGFFIHYDYVQGWLPQIQTWTAVHESCCQAKAPPSNAILLHWRDFNQDDGKQFSTPDTDWVKIYVDLMDKLRHDEVRQHVDLGGGQQPQRRRPLVILTQPSSVQTSGVQTLANLTNATIETGVDVPDAMCLLQRHESIVLLSYASTFSQGPVLFGSSADKKNVHYPLVKLQKPAVTVRVPFWHYHLVGETGVERFEVPVEEVQLS